MSWFIGALPLDYGVLREFPLSRAYNFCQGVSSAGPHQLLSRQRQKLPAGNSLMGFDVVPLCFGAYYVDDDRH